MKERPTNTYLSLGAYARTFGLSRQTVKKLLAAHLLDTYQVLGLRRIKNLAPDRHDHAQPKSNSAAPPPVKG